MYAPLQTGSKDLRSECMTILKVVCAAAAVRAAPSAAAMVASTSTNLRPMRWQTVMIASPLERCHGSAGGRPTPSCQAEFVRQDAAGYRLLSPYPTPGGAEQIEGIGGQVRAWAALHALSGKPLRGAADQQPDHPRRPRRRIRNHAATLVPSKVWRRASAAALGRGRDLPAGDPDRPWLPRSGIRRGTARPHTRGAGMYDVSASDITPRSAPIAVISLMSRSGSWNPNA